MAHVVQSIEIGRSAADAYEEWTEYEAVRPFLAALRRIRKDGASLDWRGEVLTVAPLQEAALVSLRMEYDALGASADVRRSLAEIAHRLRTELERFKAFAEARGAGAGTGWPAAGATSYA